jgi:LytS/YehU family sensor histidine kinase
LHRQQLIVRIANSIPKTSTAVVGPQVGMENVKRQLELLYPSHQLSVTSDVDTFRVMLTIPKL